MPRQHAAIAKIARPRLPKVLPRKRLFHQLDKGRLLPVTWVSGPAGSGKTTLVADYLDARKLPCLWYQLDESDGDIATFFYYMSLAAKKAAPRHRTPLPLLTMEYLRGVPAFTRRYFENLCSRLKPPFVIVLDNYHHVAQASPFHEVIREVLTIIPEGISVIITSRAAPPPSLALLQTYNKMHCLGWDELKFDLSETKSLLKSEGRKPVNEQTLAQVYNMTTGWAAGLVLLVERLKTQGLTPDELSRFKPHELFDYFATELFEKADRDMQTFLLRTSFLPRISLHAAKELTGRKDAGPLLDALRRNHFFTEQRSAHEPIYQYHPLFREFLRARAWATYTHDEMRTMLGQAAALLDGAGETHDAAELYRTLEDWSKFSLLVRSNAPAVISQGRNRTLEEWLKSIPGELLDQDPWLLYWTGVCRMPFNLVEGRQCFERSFTLFKKQRNASGAFLSWAGAIESLSQEVGDVRQLDSWIALLDELIREYGGIPSPHIEAQVTSCIFVALWMRQPWHPDFPAWRSKALALLDTDAELSRRMITAFYLYSYHYWVGDYHTCERVIDAMRRTTKSHRDISPLAYNVVITSEAWFAWAKGSFADCSRKIQEGLAKSNESGVHLWDKGFMVFGVLTSLCSGNLAGAENPLDSMGAEPARARLMDKFYYHHLTAWRYFLRDDISQAMIHQEQATALSERMGLWFTEGLSHFANALLLRATGQHEKAREQSALCGRVGEKYGSKFFEFRSYLLEAALAFDEKNERTGAVHLGKALALGREQGYAYYAWWLPSFMTDLCIKALEAGIEVGFVKGLIRRCNLVPDVPLLHIEQWPWPVRIYTLGRFEILRDDASVRFSGKVQKKPLELLKALIALGGKEVSQERLSDLLWPDSEGDASHSAFSTTLQRLRALVGNEQALQLQEGKLSLNPRLCWTDAWAFERVVEEAEDAWKDQAFASAMQASEKAMALYKGHFLPADRELAWTVSYGERLRSRFLRIVSHLGTHYEQTDQCDRTVDCYLRSLDIDDLAEEHYQKLMLCYKKLGRTAEAVAVYKRCCAALSVHLGATPSEKTEAIYSTLRR